MKVLFISKYGNEIRENKLDKLNNISSVYGYFFYHNFITFCKDKNIPLTAYSDGLNIDFNSIENDTYDYCFYLYNRGISLLDPNKYKILKSKIKHKIFTIAPTSKIQGDEDCLLFYAGKQKERTLRIPMVSDSTHLPRLQNNDKITILVDHEYYGNKNSSIFKRDKTHTILKSLLQFKKKWTEKPIEIIQINTGVPSGYSIINSEEDIKPYNRLKATSFTNIYKIYSKSDIFVVTHPEALGLSCVECNQAGCKVVSPRDYIKPIFGKDLDIVYVDDDNYEWENIINSLNSFRTHRKVRNLTYYKAIRYIFKKLNL